MLFSTYSSILATLTAATLGSVSAGGSGNTNANKVWQSGNITVTGMFNPSPNFVFCSSGSPNNPALVVNDNSGKITVQTTGLGFPTTTITSTAQAVFIYSGVFAGISASGSTTVRLCTPAAGSTVCSSAFSKTENIPSGTTVSSLKLQIFDNSTLIACIQASNSFKV